MSQFKNWTLNHINKNKDIGLEMLHNDLCKTISSGSLNSEGFKYKYNTLKELTMLLKGLVSEGLIIEGFSYESHDNYYNITIKGLKELRELKLNQILNNERN